MLFGAVDRLQAALMHDEMSAIIQAVPEFAAMTQDPHRRAAPLIEVMDGPGRVRNTRRYRPMRGAGTVWRRRCGHMTRWPRRRDRRLFDALRTAMGKRKRWLGIILSTQAEDDEHPLSQLIDDGLTGIDPSLVVDLTCGAGRMPTCSTMT